MTVKGQIEELKRIIEDNVNRQAILIGHSWGAMLSALLTAKCSHLVRKIILVASGSFEEVYCEDLRKSRESKLSQKERMELQELRQALENFQDKELDETFARFGMLMEKLDTYDGIEMKEEVENSYEIFRNVWSEAHTMRKRGELYRIVKDIQCPVVAIHGDYDSHPIEGIRDSLGKVIENFKFYELKHCGHTPWKEVHARYKFFEILKSELEDELD